MQKTTHANIISRFTEAQRKIRRFGFKILHEGDSFHITTCDDSPLIGTPANIICVYLSTIEEIEAFIIGCETYDEQIIKERDLLLRRI